MKKHTYIAHPLGNGAEREQNRSNAGKWVVWAAKHMNVVPHAMWIVLSGEWSGEHRELGLALDFEAIRRCDQVFLVGGRVSPGMFAERQFANSIGVQIYDLTYLGALPPAGMVAL